MTTLNNQSMKTVVETFIIEETSELIYDNEQLEKWHERINELELTGQKNVVTVGKSPIPFLWMNSALISTFETLCPTKTEIQKYDKTPIPVEILDLVALAKREQYFSIVEIWYNETEKDPVCVGYHFGEKSNGESEYWKKSYAEKYLIGRWADVKASLDTLIEKAKKLYITQRKNQIQLNIKRAQRELEDLEQNAETSFSGGMPETNLTGLEF